MKESRTKIVFYDGRRYRQDERTGYYLPSASVDGKRKRLHVFVYEKYNGPVPKGMSIHHKDEKKDNNEPENLIAMDKKLHSKYHFKKYCQNNREAVMKNLIEVAIPASAIWHGSEEGRAWHSEHGKKAFEGRIPVSSKCVVCGKEHETYYISRSMFCSKACKAKYRRIMKLDHVKKSCSVCGKEFSTSKYDGSLTCSRHCGGVLNANNRASKSKVS